jgi:hypothetical protein
MVHSVFDRSRRGFVVAVAASISVALVRPVAGQDTSATFLMSQTRTTGMIGISAGDSVRINVLNPGLPAPLLGILCFAQLAFVDDQNNQLRDVFYRVLPGHSVSLTLNADSDVTLGSDGRLEIRGVLRTPPLLNPPPPDVLPIPVNTSCPLVATLEVFNNETGRTRLILPDFSTVFPPMLTPLPQPPNPNP